MTLPFFASLLEKERKVNLTYETDTLRVLPVGRGQTQVSCYFTNFRLRKGTDGEHYVVKLLLAHLAEEVTLVLVPVMT